MTNRLFAIDDKIVRAEDHLTVIKDVVRAYFHSDVCRYRGKYDPNTRQHAIEHNITFPDVRLATLAGEMIHDLRSALDHLANRLVEANDGTPIQGPGGTTWPVLKTPPAQGLEIAGGVSATAMALAERAQPYRLAGPHPEYDALWILHRLSIIDKHQQIPIQGVTPDHFSGFYNDPALPPFTWTSELITADERHAEVRVVPDDPTLRMDGTFSVFVVVQEPPGHPPVLTNILGGALAAVRDIVDEARRTCFT